MKRATFGSLSQPEFVSAVGVNQDALRDIVSRELHGAIETVGIADGFAAEGGGFAKF